MLAIIKQFFSDEAIEVNKTLGDDEKRLACAALLIEVAIVDQNFDEVEMIEMRKIITNTFDINDEDCLTLINLAKKECDEASSTYQFTQHINQHCSVEDKFTLLKGMWRVAYADGNLDKYEEYVIRKVSDLIHMSHSDYIKAKLIAKTE